MLVVQQRSSQIVRRLLQRGKVRHEWAGEEAVSEEVDSAGQTREAADKGKMDAEEGEQQLDITQLCCAATGSYSTRQTKDRRIVAAA